MKKALAHFTAFLLLRCLLTAGFTAAAEASGNNDDSKTALVLDTDVGTDDAQAIGPVFCMHKRGCFCTS